jgi:hypothetical protein
LIILDKNLGYVIENRRDEVAVVGKQGDHLNDFVGEFPGILNPVGFEVKSDEIAEGCRDFEGFIGGVGFVFRDVEGGFIEFFGLGGSWR